jgi:L-aminopeptidase/D-esterase-like protein
MMTKHLSILACLVGLAAPGAPDAKARPAGATVQTTAAVRGLTGIEGIRVGHYTLKERPTGCTVILADGGAVASVDVRGAAPAARETDLLEPGALVERINAIVLSGGSAFGLDAASGVMRYLEERKIGFEFGGAYVPIVPGASLFDLAVGDPRIRPDADCGYRAAQAASAGPIAEGSVGAGAGATIGKAGGLKRAMKGGVGTAAVTLPGGIVVAALVAVNARGDIVDPSTGRIVAGVRSPDGKGFSDARTLIRGGLDETPLQNTTLGVVATNATLTKAQARRVATMAHDGYARAIVPAHTMSDGDLIFTLATGTHTGEVNLTAIGHAATDAVVEAILRAVHESTGLPGFPAVRDLKR